MSKSLSSGAIIDRNGQTGYRIDAHKLEKSSPKFKTYILNRCRENHVSQKRFRRRDRLNSRVASLLKKDDETERHLH